MRVYWVQMFGLSADSPPILYLTREAAEQRQAACRAAYQLLYQEESEICFEIVEVEVGE